MSNSAVVAFVDKQTPRPEVAVYMHWNGGAESVYAILDVMRERRGMVHSASYSTARFAHLACELLGHDGLSVGVERFTQKHDMAGMAFDHGLFIFDISTERMVERVVRVKDTADKFRKLSEKEMRAEEMQARGHKYWDHDQIREKLRAALPVKEVA